MNEQLNLSNKVNILDFLRGGMSLVEVGWPYGKNESSTISKVLNSMHPEHLLLFLKSSLLRNIDQWIWRFCWVPNPLTLPVLPIMTLLMFFILLQLFEFILCFYQHEKFLKPEMAFCLDVHSLKHLFQYMKPMWYCLQIFYCLL
jgi:hypothetical protein